MIDIDCGYEKISTGSCGYEKLILIYQKITSVDIDDTINFPHTHPQNMSLIKFFFAWNWTFLVENDVSFLCHQVRLFSNI
jgi:hypothetical protein